MAYLEFLVLRALFEVYEGNRTYAADRVKDDIDNISKPANASEVEHRIAEYPQQGIEALVSSICPHIFLVHCCPVHTCWQPRHSEGQRLISVYSMAEGSVR